MANKMLEELLVKIEKNKESSVISNRIFPKNISFK